ncbi:MAG: dethiobiotin synthase [Proteobacteria bacterium SG_bin5]|nr:dethiobiotin synthase [Sphingomonas sp.]MBX9814614.1 dethiobiotin synthase [Sphingomonas sp.]OQW39637.1 MAG: dethiobiotin synthase [Proteobacteria bacterium SG_bin5]
MRLIVTGTDTGIGKTVFAAGLAAALGAHYWKPVQSGLDGPESDSETVARLGRLPPKRILPEAYRLTEPLSPHRAAELDGVTIDPARLAPPPHGRLVIEGAGGLMVPITRQLLAIDWFATMRLPVVLCARTALGTINHSLLSVEALRARGIPLHGIAFIGEDMPDTIRTIADLSGARVLGRLPLLDPLTPESLATAFAAGIAL